MSDDSLRSTFDQVPELYDRARPKYPSQLIRDLADLAGIGPGSRVVEIGPGTGQATEDLAALGASVLAVELGADLAQKLRSKNLPRVTVVDGDFTDPSVALAASFDAVTAFTSWHWLASPQRTDRVLEALVPDGWLVTVTTRHVIGGTVAFFEAAQRCYRQWGPTAAAAAPLLPPTQIRVDHDEVDDDPRFTPAARRRYVRDIEYTTGTYLDLLQTYSGHRSMNTAARTGLLKCLAHLIDNHHHGRIIKSYLFELRAARRLPR